MEKLNTRNPSPQGFSKVNQAVALQMCRRTSVENGVFRREILLLFTVRKD
jgi:hypothetical protein